MPHCLVAIFSNAKGTWAEHTGWKSEAAAYQALKDTLTANAKNSVDWVGWSYWDPHTHDGTLIRESLEGLAKHLEKLCTSEVRNRTSLKSIKEAFNPFKNRIHPLKLFTRSPAFEIEVWPTQKGESQHGFMYAKIIKSWRASSSEGSANE